MVDAGLGKDCITLDHIAALHKLQYLPLHVKAIPEGTLVPTRVPVMTLYNTVDHAFWLPNALETLISATLWGMMTSATTAFQFRKRFMEHAKAVGLDPAFTKWQGHDFSMRGMFGVEAAILSGSAHLLSFTGTDTIPALPFHERYYGANLDTDLVGGSVPATEHSVMCLDGRAGELALIRRLITEIYPKGIVSIVCDTYDFWKVITQYLPSLEAEIKARDGKVVVRPDSGDPVKIICGDPSASTWYEQCGAIETLGHIFGSTKTAKGARLLSEKVGLIYGDSINLQRQEAILSGMAAKGWAFNGVLGIGSYTYQHVTRDTYGFAIKATYAELEAKDGGREARAIFKQPKTDDGLKNSARGLLHVADVDGLTLFENVDWATEQQGLLQTIFLDGNQRNQTTLAEIRARVEAQL